MRRPVWPCGACSPRPRLDDHRPRSESVPDAAPPTPSPRLCRALPAKGDRPAGASYVKTPGSASPVVVLTDEQTTYEPVTWDMLEPWNASSPSGAQLVAYVHLKPQAKIDECTFEWISSPSRRKARRDDGGPRRGPPRLSPAWTLRSTPGAREVDFPGLPLAVTRALAKQPAAGRADPEDPGRVSE